MKRITLIVSVMVLTLVGSVLLAAEPESSPPQQAMQEMHSRMQTMQEQMTRIKETKDPEERKPLMQEHMQSMREGMMMMIEMEQDGKSKMRHDAMEQHKHASPCDQDENQCQQMQAMDTGQHNMQARMRLMRMMMQQMMDHQTALDLNE